MLIDEREVQPKKAQSPIVVRPSARVIEEREEVAALEGLLLNGSHSPGRRKNVRERVFLLCFSRLARPHSRTLLPVELGLSLISRTSRSWGDHLKLSWCAPRVVVQVSCCCAVLPPQLPQTVRRPMAMDVYGGDGIEGRGRLRETRE